MAFYEEGEIIMKKPNIKIDLKKVLPMVGGALTLAGMFVSSKIDSNNRNDLKEELKKEVLAELTSDKN